MNKYELIEYCKEAGQTISELDYKNRILEKENQELKSQLKGTTHCFDEEEHKRLSEQLELLTSKLDEYDLIVDERNQLKKQLEEAEKCLKDMYHINIENDKELEKAKTQQKEFIKWLENGIEKVKNTEFLDERIQRAGLIAYNRCLQKYKKIIGDDK